MLRNQEARTDTLHGCLNHLWRRYTLYYLKNADRSRALADLAEYVARRESDTPGGELDKEFVKDVYLKLYHVHVPKLADAGLVEYDQEDDTVALLEYPGDLIDERELADESRN